MTTEKTAEKKPEYIKVDIARPRSYRWSSGKYLGKLYKEALEKKKLVTNRCPSASSYCGRPRGPAAGATLRRGKTGWR